MWEYCKNKEALHSTLVLENESSIKANKSIALHSMPVSTAELFRHKGFPRELDCYSII